MPINSRMISTLEFTEEEIEKIEQLRSRVAADLITKFQNENAYLIRWLRARNMNVNQAEEMLRKSLQWRKKYNVDGILEREKIPDNYKALIPYAYLGMEPETGCPIYLSLTGRLDFRSIVEAEGSENALRYMIIFMELGQKYMKENAKKVGRPVTSYIEVMDLEGYCLWQVGTRQAREVLQQIQKMCDENYPESMKFVIMVNAPKVFAFVFNMMKPFIPKATLEKIEIHGSDAVKWKEVIAKKIPMELVPKHWGGTLTGNDEYCSNSDIWVHGALGPNYFSGADEHGFIKTKVNARDKFHVEVDVDESNALLEWKFRTEDHDISFGLSKEDVELIPLKRVDSHKEVQEGRHKCEATGTYKLVFDNTYSYTRAKTLFHKIEITTDNLNSSSLEDIGTCCKTK